MTAAQPLRPIPLRTATPPGQADTDHEPPEWLTPEATDAWNRLWPHLKPTPAERDQFAAYCEAISEFHYANLIIAETGSLIIDPTSGFPTPSPAATIRDRADRKIAAWGQYFRTR